MAYWLQCIECSRKYEKRDIVYTCPHCNGLFEVKYDLDEVSKIIAGHEEFKRRNQGIWSYREILPIEKETNPISLQEGGTPLYHCKKLGNELGIKKLYVKHEGMNPSGSFKDRGISVGVTKAIALNFDAVACASTGNTSASLAMYSAYAGIKCFVLLPEGAVAIGKVSQAMIHGAEIIKIKGNFDFALELVKSLTTDPEKGIYLLNSVNPFRLEGQKTIGFEIFEQLGEVPDNIVVPTGNAGNISAIWKGIKEFKYLGFIEKIPRMISIQSKGASPIVRAIKNNYEKIQPILAPETIATAIRIGNPVNAPKALRAIKESNGIALAVYDEEIIQAQKDLARLEGIGVEPASAASIAGVKNLFKNGQIDKDEKTVCIATGHVLKDPDEIVAVCKEPMKLFEDEESLRAFVEKRLSSF